METGLLEPGRKIQRKHEGPGDWTILPMLHVTYVTLCHISHQSRGPKINGWQAVFVTIVSHLLRNLSPVVHLVRCSNPSLKMDSEKSPRHTQEAKGTIIGEIRIILYPCAG